MATKVTKRPKVDREQITVKTNVSKSDTSRAYAWWQAASKSEKSDQVLSTAGFLKEQQQYRFRQASVHGRLYGNMPLMPFAGSSLSKTNIPNNLPIDRPTMNVVQSCIDTLTSRITQAKPRPLFLTDNGEYKQRSLAKQLNGFIAGELYQTKAYELAETIFRDACIVGTGVVKVYTDARNRVALERVLNTELYVDSNDAFYGKPRTMYQLKLVDRSVLKEWFPEYRSKIESAEEAYPDNSAESQKTTADQVMLVEAWHLPSGPEAKDGQHVIACTGGLLLDEDWTKDDFPFVFLHYSPRMIGFWAQGLAEQLVGTQVEINKLLMTISQSISLVGVPRVFIEEGSKVVKAHINNNVGSIVTYRGTEPIIVPGDSGIAPDIYAQLQRLVDFAYQQSGISTMTAAGQKPMGLNSGEAQRVYDDIQSDRFAVIQKRFEQMFIDLAYKITDEAKCIAEETGEYETVYPNKDGTRQINLPEAKLLGNPFVIQCFDTSSLPRDPAGRAQKVVEYMQSGLLSPDEGRRLLNFPDLEQVDKLKFAAVERIYKQLDDIVESGKFSPPDPDTDLLQGISICGQYINLYLAANLEEAKAEKLRAWKTQCIELQQASQPQPSVQTPQPTGVPGQPPIAQLASTVPH